VLYVFTKAKENPLRGWPHLCKLIRVCYWNTWSLIWCQRAIIPDCFSY